MKRIGRPSPAMVVALIGVGIGLGGVASATIPDSGGDIHGCFNKNNGNLRVVAAAGNCRQNENALDWKQGQGDGARAYGRVLPDGTLDPARSSNIESVTHHANQRVYCIELDFTPANVVATQEAKLPGQSTGGGGSIAASVDPAVLSALCPGAEAVVDVFSISDVNSFFVLIH